MPRVVPQPQPSCAERVCPIRATPRHSDTLPLGWLCQTAAEWVVLAKVTPEVSCKKKHECEGSRTEQGQLELAAQDCTPLGFEYLQNVDSTTSLDNLLQCFGHPHRGLGRAAEVEMYEGGWKNDKQSARKA